jgi:regulator of cell morphogenesis and NO signaling
MTINVSDTVREIALGLPESTMIFENLAIDYCCGGGKSLAESCEIAGVETERVVGLLEDVVNARTKDTKTDFRALTQTELSNYIVAKHHDFTREELGRLDALLNKVCEVHGKNHAELFSIRKSFTELRNDLLPHMLKEEQVLFPYIQRVEGAIVHNQPLAPAFFGSVSNPVQKMMLEHDQAGEILRDMRKVSSGYQVPAETCISYKTLYERLESLEQDLHQHIHLENNILFPRAQEMENGLVEASGIELMGHACAGIS